MPEHKKNLLTYEEACARMGWSIDTLRRRLRDREIPRVKDGGGFKIDPADLLKWIERNKQ